MSWQDLVLGAGQLLFSLALVPALRSPAKPPRSTCVLTGSVLLAFAATFATLGFWWSTAASLICGVLWLALAAQSRT